jgi:hypothetical protein
MMTLGRRRRLAQIEQRIADAAHPWLHTQGLASLLAWDKAHPEPDDDDDGVYIDCAGAPGLRGLLFYQLPQGADLKRG